MECQMQSIAFRRSLPWAACRAGLLGWLVLGAATCALDDRHPTTLPTSTEQQSERPSPEQPGGAPNGEAGLSLSRTELDLGAAVTGFAAFGRVTLSNVGAEPLELSNIALAGTGDADFRIAQ